VAAAGEEGDWAEQRTYEFESMALPPAP
jgi:hypothetical protein